MVKLSDYTNKLSQKFAENIEVWCKFNFIGVLISIGKEDYLTLSFLPFFNYNFISPSKMILYGVYFSKLVELLQVFLEGRE